MATKKTKTPAPASASAEPDKTKIIEVETPPGKSRDRLAAELAVGGVAGNASTLIAFSRGTFGEMSLTDCARVLGETARGVNGGDLKTAETMLMVQAVALNAVFGELARRAALNMGGYLDATETYMRLALKAQGQCRATLETLAAIKNPPVVFARQANIAHGPQQVNNGTVPSPVAPAAKPESVKTQLLEASDGQRLDTGATGKAGGADPHLETVEAVHRPAHR